MNWAANIWGRFAGYHRNTGPVAEGNNDMATVTKIPERGQPQAGTIHWLNECFERSKREVFMEVCMVTPGLASAMLSNNPDNRPLKWKRDLYAADMRAGRWSFNGEPIIFADTGELNDGQNRLHAVIDANSPQLFACVFGVSRQSRMSVDQGAARSAGDYLGMGGVKNAHNAASIAKGVLSFERGDGIRLATNEITNAEITARAKNDPAIAAATEYAVSVYRHTRAFAAPKVIGTAFYLLADIDEDDARAYMDAVCIGEGLRRTDPAFAAREALIAWGKTRMQAKLEVIFRGWVAHRQGRSLKIAKVLGSFPALV